MSTTTTSTTTPAAPPAIARERLPYHNGLQERFGIDRSAWRALTDAVFPAAQSTEAVILALSYCKARNLDPFKRQCHVVPIWDKAAGRYVETVWPSISELRTTAFRTGRYAGRDETKFGPDVTTEFSSEKESFKLTFPEWAQITVYRLVEGIRQPFPGPTVYWTESFAQKKGGIPNDMWKKRPRGQLEKCAEAAALRGAFPEELGGELCSDEVGGAGFSWHGRPAIAAEPGKSRTEALADRLAGPAEPPVIAPTHQPIDVTPPKSEPARRPKAKQPAPSAAETDESPPKPEESAKPDPVVEPPRDAEPVDDEAPPEAVAADEAAADAPPPELYGDLAKAIAELKDVARSLPIRQRIEEGGQTGELTHMGVTALLERLEAKCKALRGGGRRR